MINEHRKLGKQLELFNISDSASGMVNWYPKGYEIYRKIEQYVRSVQDSYGYREVRSPILANQQLWEKSGHSDKYDDSMFHVVENNLAIKPMSCPFHINIFNDLVHSYRELPYRISEVGLCHRNEPSGSLNGLFRLRAFNQDDGHIFCREEHIKNELQQFCNMVFEMYFAFGFKKSNVGIKISLRPENRIGSDELWDRSELYLQQGLNELGLRYELIPGEGAFYGAKVEFSLKDSVGREWQCGTFQLDIVLSSKFDCSYINEDGDKEHPVILHRAALGSLERFIAILLEHHKGKLPIWLNPNSIILLPVDSKHIEFCLEIKKELNENDISCVIDSSDNSIGYKVRSSFKQKCNYSIVIGDEELEQGELNLRVKKSLQKVSRDELVGFLKQI